MSEVTVLTDQLFNMSDFVVYPRVFGPEQLINKFVPFQVTPLFIVEIAFKPPHLIPS